MKKSFSFYEGDFLFIIKFAKWQKKLQAKETASKEIFVDANVRCCIRNNLINIISYFAVAKYIITKLFRFYRVLERDFN